MKSSNHGLKEAWEDVGFGDQGFKGLGFGVRIWDLGFRAFGFKMPPNPKP